MIHGDVVESIHYSFDRDGLVDGLDVSRYDVDASVHLYQDLCIAAIRDTFLSATDVHVDSSGVTDTNINGYIEHEDVELIQYICDELRLTDKWYVEISTDELLTVLEAHAQFEIPTAIIRHACAHGWIKGANNKASQWLFSKRSFLQFQSTYIRGGTNSLLWELAIPKQDRPFVTGIDHNAVWNEYFYVTEDVQEVCFVLKRFDLPQPFTERNCCIYWKREDSDRVNFTLFGDVENLNHPKEHSFFRYAKTIVEQATLRGYEASLQAYLVSISFPFRKEQDQSLGENLSSIVETLHSICEDTEIAIEGGPIWKDEYLTQEKPFCHEVLAKLLERMRFSDIENRHGSWEFGKDFTFTETTSFGQKRFYGLQAKAGNISGAVTSGGKAKTDGQPSKTTPISEILEQLDDAFSVPYRYQGTGESRFISVYIIAISGYLTENAKEKLWWKLQRQGRIGMVHVWDKAKIQELIRQHWLSNHYSSTSIDWTLKIDVFD